MNQSVIEGQVTSRHEHEYDFLEATPDSTWFFCKICKKPLQEHEDAGTGA